MGSDVVQFRHDRAALDALRAAGVNPNDLARQAFEAALRRRSAEETSRRLARIKARLPKPIAEIVREARDDH